MFGHRGVYRVLGNVLFTLQRGSFKSLSLAMALSLIINCSGSSSSGSGGGSTPTEGEGTITGSKGGTVRSLDGRFLVTIPAGESSAKVSITVTIATNQVPSAALKSLVGDAYEVTVAKGSLASSATIALEYEPSRVIAPAGTSVSSLVSLARLSGESWQPVDGATVDSANNLITASVSSFSIFGVIQKAPPIVPPSTGGGGSGGGGSTADTIPPDTSLASSPLSLSSSKKASFILVSTEKDSTFECKLDTAGFSSCSTPLEYSSVADGDHELQVRAKDKAGNVDPTPLVFKWTVDATAPGAPDAAKLTVTDNASPTLDYLMGLAGAVPSGASSITVYSDSSLGNQVGSQTIKTDGSFDATSIGSDQRDAGAMIYIVAVDAAGNASSATSFRADWRGVESQITSSPASTLINQDAVFQFGPAGTESATSYQCAVDAAAFTACTSPHTTGTLALGSHTFYVKALDQFGNAGTAVSKTWTLNPQAVTLSTTPPSTTVNLKGQVVFTANPTGTGITYQCRVDAAAFASCASPFAFGGLSFGSHTAEIKPFDKFGNVGSIGSHAWSIIVGPNAVDGAGQDNGSTVDFTKGSNGGLNAPKHAAMDVAGKRLFVSDTTNHRILVFDLNSNFTLVDRYADYILGQPNHEANSSTTPSALIPDQSQWGMKSPTGLAVYNSMLFVSDSGNNRILVLDARSAGSANLVLCGFTSNGLADGMKASCVLGQAGFLTSAAATAQNGLSDPEGLSAHKDLAELYVADTGNHRVLVHNISALANGQNAANVIGQANFTTGTANRGGATAQNTLSAPTAVAYYHHSSDDTYRYLAIADRGNNRVLIHSKVTAPTATAWDDGENAVYRLGQKTWAGNAADAEDSTVAGSLCGDEVAPNATNACGMDSPQGLAWSEDRSRLYVGDTENHRVMIFDSGTIASNEPAANVLGQSALTTYVSPTSTGPSTLSLTTTPSNLTGNMLAADTMVPVTSSTGYPLPARVQIDSEAIQCTTSTAIQLETCTRGFKGTTVPPSNPPTSYSHTSGTAVQLLTSSPVGLVFSENAYGRLYVADTGANRIEMFTVFPGAVTNGQAATDSIGHLTTTGGASFSVPSPNNPSPGNFFSPVDAAFDAGALRLYMTDSKLNRIVSFNLNSSLSLLDRSADNVLGQSTLTASGAAVTQASGLDSPEGIAFDSTAKRLYVADRANHRVLVYETSVLSDGMNASFVLGQPDYVTATPLCSTTKMSSPTGVAVDAPGKRLYVADSGNHRVMVYDTTSLSNGMAAIKFLGEWAGCTSGTTQSVMKNPKGVDFHPNSYKLFVADTGNNRILVFNVGSGGASITNGMNSSNVLGQSGFVTGTAGTTSTTLNSPTGVEVDQTYNRLFVADTANNRVVIADLDALTDGMAFINAIGQSDLSTGSVSATAVNRLRAPRASAYDPVSNRLWVIDNQNNRITIFETR